MTKLRPYGMPIEWRNAALADRLEALVQHYCTGPCGQSQTVGEIQSNTSKTLREARAELARTRDERDGAIAEIGNQARQRGVVMAERDGLREACEQALMWFDVPGNYESYPDVIARLKAALYAPKGATP